MLDFSNPVISSNPSVARLLSFVLRAGRKKRFCNLHTKQPKPHENTMRIRLLGALVGLEISFDLPTFAQQSATSTSSPATTSAASGSQEKTDENPLLGTWKLQSLVFEAMATGQRSSPFGDHPVGYLSYSPDGRMYAIVAAEDRPKPRDLFPTDAEKVKLYETFLAYAGTYRVDGEKVIHHVDTSWNQSWTGTDLVRFYKLDGNTLTITTARAQSPFGEGQFILVWEKVQ
jgi:hypothetical protein